MAISINNTTEIKDAVEIFKEFNADGKKCEFVTADINGFNRNIGFVVTESEEDRRNAEEFFKYISNASNGNIMEMMHKLTTIATIEEKEIEPDEMIEVNGEEVIISYKNAAAYTIYGEEIVNCADLPSMPVEAIKAVLVARIEAIM